MIDPERERETMSKKFLIEVEPAKQATDGRPSVGPVYRSIFAKDGFPAPIPGMESCWDIFRSGFVFFVLFCFGF